MTDRVADDEICNEDALYALGALPTDEAKTFEAHVAEGCEACSNETAAYDNVVRSLGFAADEAEPPARVRTKLLARIAAERTAALFSIKGQEGEWECLIKGVFSKTLYFDAATGVKTSLVRMLPGTRLPAHRHIGVEQIYILEGDCGIQDESLGPGDFHIAGPETIHELTHTVNGTLFLLIGPQGYEFF